MSRSGRLGGIRIVARAGAPAARFAHVTDRHSLLCQDRIQAGMSLLALSQSPRRGPATRDLPWTGSMKTSIRSSSGPMTRPINQEMSQLNLGLRFGFVFVPARSFQHLLTIDLQRRSLEAIRRHLEPTGRVVLHLFDPRLDLLIDSNSIRPVLSGTHPETGLRYTGEVLRTNFDHLNQVRHDLWQYTEMGPHGEVLAEHSRDGPSLDLSLGAASSAETLRPRSLSI